MMNNTTIDGIDYGPLACLVGVWSGADGIDVAPEPNADEHNPYYETLTFVPAGDVSNAEEQTLSVVRYHQVVSRKSNDKVFHDQVGYWLWDPATGVICQTLSIPRAVALLAGGSATVDGDVTHFKVAAKEDDAQWSIVQSPFMQTKARTTGFSHAITVTGNSLVYSQTTVLDIYDKPGYQHTDGNSLVRQG